MAASPGAPPPALSDVIANRQWHRRPHPFPHVVAENVFTPQFHAGLEAAYRAALQHGLRETPCRGHFSRNMPGYDAYGLGLDAPGLEPFGLFRSWAWHAMLARLFDIDASGHVHLGLHHHPAGSRDGWVHNDLNPGWFVDAGPCGEVSVPQGQLCSYTGGASTPSGVAKIETVRALTMILYLANGDWPGDAGGTGLYSAGDQDVRDPDVVVRPVDNSLLAFECTPWSFHGFIGGNVQPRNSLILWLHRPKHAVVARWGAHAIRYWPGGAGGPT